MLSIPERLKRFRDQLRVQNIDAYIIPTDDAHGSEYPPKSESRRTYISGFTGSAGTAVVTQTEALLWTDGRYYSQAGQQLDPKYWTLMKDVEAPSIGSWLKNNKEANRIGYDGAITSISSYSTIHSVLSEMQPPKEYVAIVDNLVDEVWNTDGRPQAPHSEVIVHPVQYSGIEVQDKLKDVREKLIKENVHGVVLSRLDDTAWITNLRASDIEYSPVFLSYIYITMDDFILYIDSSRLSNGAKKHLSDNTVELRPYDSIFGDLQNTYGKPGEALRLWLDESANMKLYHSVDDPKKRVLVKLSPVQLPKAIKNGIELAGMKEAHIKDGVALCTFLAWLEDLAMNNENELKQYTEWTVAQKLDNLRMSMLDNRGLSFNTISSIGPNAAVIHYAAEENTALHLSRDLYLVDSGGQYLQGTTDVTRTLHLGTPTDIQKKCFTLVLKGHLQLARQIFPKGTKGSHLDGFARQYLWMNGLNFAHGTGHGVGSYLNVHEGPQRIRSPLTKSNGEVNMEVGMIISNEPGYYKDGQFGIRIENLLFTKKVDRQLIELQEGDYYEFEDLTLAPHQKKMIELTLLSDEELDQLNAYHQRVKAILVPYISSCADLPHKELTLSWIEDSTSPLVR